MADKRFEMILDLAVAMKANPAEVEKVAKQIENILENHDFGVDIDMSQAKKAFETFGQLIKLSESDLKVLRKELSQLDLKFDTSEMEKAFNELETQIKNLDNIDLSKIEDVFKNISDDDLEKIKNTLADAAENFDQIKFGKEISKLATEFSKADTEAKQFLQTQKLALAQMKLSGQEGSESYKKLQQEIENTEKSVEQYGKALGGLDNIAPAKETFIDLAANFEAVGQLGEQLSGFAAKGIEVRDAMIKVQAQTGLTADEMDRLNESAERAFKAGVGESLGQAIIAIGKSKQLLGDFLDPKGIEDFTIGAAGIAKVFDKDINEVIAGSRPFISNFKLDGVEAANLVGLAMRESGSKMDDTLDTLDEYSQLVKSAGYNAQEFVGVITTGMQLGTRDTDKLADAIKETQIRLNAGDTQTALASIKTPITESIKAIVDLGAKGQLTIKEVLQQSSQVMKDSFDGGKISIQMRDQLAVALSGTMAEDIGGDLYTKIFSAKIDTNAINQRAKEAGDAINNNLGPVNFGEVIQQQFDIIATKASVIVGPALDTLGKSLQSIAKIAPGLSLIRDIVPEGAVNKIKGLALSILHTLIPSIVGKTTVEIASTASTEAATVAQYAFNAAALLNPYLLGVVGLIAAVVAIKLIADALIVTTEEQIKNNEASQKLIDKQIESDKARRSQIQSHNDLVDSYEKLGKAREKSTKTGKEATEEETRFKNVQLELHKAFPGVIEDAKGFAINLENVKKKAEEGKTKIANLNNDIYTLADKKIILEVELKKLDVQKSMDDLEDEIQSDVGFFDISGMFKAVNTKDILKPYFEAIKNAKTEGQLQDAQDQLKDAIYDNKLFEFDDTQKDQAINAVEEIVKKQGVSMKTEQDKNIHLMDSYLNRLFETNLKGLEKLDIKAYAKERGVTEKEVTDAIIANGAKEIAVTKDKEAVYQSIAKLLKMSPEHVKELIGSQQKSTEKTKEMAEAVKSLGQQWDEVTKKASTEYSDALGGMEILLKKGRGNWTEKDKADFEAQRIKAKIWYGETQNNIKINNEAKKISDTLDKKNAVTALEGAKKAFEFQEKILQAKLQSTELLHKELVLTQGRELTEVDELYNLEKKLETQKLIYDEFVKQFESRKLLTKDDKGDLIVNTKLKEADQAQVQETFDKMKNDLKSSGLDVMTFRIKVNAETADIQKQLQEFEIKNLEMKIEMGIDPGDSFIKLRAIYNTQLSGITSDLEKGKTDIKAINTKYDDAITDAFLAGNDKKIEELQLNQQTEINTVEKKNIVLLNAQRDTNGKIETINENHYSKELDSIDKFYADQIAKIDKAFEDEKGKAQKFTDIFMNAYKSGSDKDKDKELDSIKASADGRIAALDQMKEDGLLIEEDYQKQKLEIQKKADAEQRDAQEESRREQMQIDAMMKGQALEMERQYNKDLADMQSDQAYKEMEILTDKEAAQGGYLSKEDKARLDAMQTQFENAMDLYKVNASLLESVISTASVGVTEAITDLFAGDPEAAGEAIKKTFSSIFGVMAQVISKKVSGVVVNLILDWLFTSKEPFLIKMVLAPAMGSIINSLIMAIVTPVLNGLLSFSTGGRIDNPTMALIGDASKLGGRNREWVTNDKQLQQIVGMGANTANMELLNEMRAMRAMLASQQLETVLKGTDIYISQKRTGYSVNQRSR